MVLPGIAGATAATIADINIMIDEVKDIAKSVGEIEGDANTDARTFENLVLPHDAFGEVPTGLNLASQHQAAHQVFDETLKGVLSDLRDFRQNLLDCANGHENNDAAVQAALVNLGKRSKKHHYVSDEKYDEGRKKNREGLAAGHPDPHRALHASDTGAPDAHDRTTSNQPTAS
jgi:hypothetical protein